MILIANIGEQTRLFIKIIRTNYTLFYWDTYRTHPLYTITHPEEQVILLIQW